MEIIDLHVRKLIKTGVSYKKKNMQMFEQKIFRFRRVDFHHIRHPTLDTSEATFIINVMFHPPSVASLEGVAVAAALPVQNSVTLITSYRCDVASPRLASCPVSLAM